MSDENKLKKKCEKCGECLILNKCPKCGEPEEGECIVVREAKTLVDRSILDSLITKMPEPIPISPIQTAMQMTEFRIPRKTEFRLSRNWDCGVCAGKIWYEQSVMEYIRATSLGGWDPVMEAAIKAAEAAREASRKKDAATRGRDRVKWEIVRQITTTGRFSAEGTADFWQKFPDSLCADCQKKLDRIQERKKQAKMLLDEAVQLDPDNDIIKRNMAAIS